MIRIDSMGFKELKYLSRRLNAVLVWHAEIHENQAILAQLGVSFNRCETIFDYLGCQFATNSDVCLYASCP